MEWACEKYYKFNDHELNLHNEGDIYIQVVINLHRAETKCQTVAINCLII